MTDLLKSLAEHGEHGQQIASEVERFAHRIAILLSPCDPTMWGIVLGHLVLSLTKQMHDIDVAAKEGSLFLATTRSFLNGQKKRGLRKKLLPA